MKSILLTAIGLFMLSGCSALKPYVDPNGTKETMLYMVPGKQECAIPFYELDGSIISGVGVVTDLVTTCGTVSDVNLSCPDNNIFCIKRNFIK